MTTGARDRTDLAIIGGGVAGCYAAYRLSQNAPDLSVHVHEMSNRFGGRLWSAPLGAGLRGVAELGGMFFADAHENVFGLVKRLGLDMRPLEFRRKGYYLRGRLLDDAMFRDSGSVPYQLRADEQGKNPYDLLLHALTRIVPDLPNLWPFAESGPLATEEATTHYLREVSVHGRQLCDWNFRNLLDAAISSEAYELLAATLGSMAALRGNAYDAITTHLWEANPRQRHFILSDGYQQLPLALKRASEHRVEFLAERRLTRIAQAPDGFKLHFATPHGEVCAEAGAVILTLPKRALELVEFDRALVDDQFHRDLETASPIPACRLFLGFASPWWNAGTGPAAAGATISASYTDQPMRQCYYFEPAGDDFALLMAAFADDAAAAFWSDLASPAHQDRSARPWLERDDAPRASQAMVDAALRQLRLMHPNAAAPDPCGAVFADWSAGAWHIWKPYVRSWRVRERMRKPNALLPLYVSSDAFAPLSGWVEATINSMEALLETHFKLARPDWVRAGYCFDV